jgi:hypothetical protein
MSADMRHHLERVAHRGHHRAPDEVVADAIENVVTRDPDPFRDSAAPRKRPVAVAVLVLAAVVMSLGIVGALARPPAELSTATSTSEGPAPTAQEVTHLYIPDVAGVEIVDASEGLGPLGHLGQIVVYGRWVGDQMEAVAVSVIDDDVTTSLRTLVPGPAVETTAGPAIQLEPSEAFDLQGLSLARSEDVVFVAGRGVDQELLRAVIELPDPTYPESVLPPDFTEIYRGPDTALDVVRTDDQIAVRTQSHSVYLAVSEGFPDPMLVAFFWGGKLDGDRYVLRSDSDRLEVLVRRGDHTVLAVATANDAEAVPQVLDLLVGGTAADFDEMAQRSVEPESIWATGPTPTLP